MYLDTSYNSNTTVLTNIYTSFLETATKMWTYAKCLPIGKQPSTKLLISTSSIPSPFSALVLSKGRITDLIEMAYVLVKSKSKNKKNEGYQCHVKKPQVEYLSLNAFRTVLIKRQRKYGKLISWLDNQLLILKTREEGGFSRLSGIVSSNVS
jgi:hypothetical protein